MLILNVSSHYDQLKLFTGIISLKVFIIYIYSIIIFIIISRIKVLIFLSVGNQKVGGRKEPS